MLKEKITSSQAQEVLQSFLRTFWNPDNNYFYTNSDRQIDPDHAIGPEGGLYTDYWWEAQIWETMMDVYERDPSLDHRKMVDNVYDGFMGYYPNWFENEYNDDIGWWALGSIRAYRLTGNERYKQIAQEMFDFIFQFWSDDYGGGIWWNRNDHLKQKNVATNATAAVIAFGLSEILEDQAYFDKAKLLIDWVRDVFYDPETGKVSDHIADFDEGQVVGWEYTYNFGTFAGACYQLYKKNNDEAYLNDAYKAIDWVISKMTLDDTIIYEGDNDGPAFKMIFARFVYTIAAEMGRPDYLVFLQRNATQAYNHRRVSDALIGADWTIVPDESPIQSIAAAAGVSILFLTPPDEYTGIIVGNGIYETENGRRFDVSNDNVEAGYLGRGYNAGWNLQDSKLILPVNRLTSGTYRITLRYSAAAGVATRTLFVNEENQGIPLTFPATTAWSDWNTIEVVIDLVAGTNVLTFTQTSEDVNWFNLDQLVITTV